MASAIYEIRLFRDFNIIKNFETPGEIFHGLSFEAPPGMRPDLNKLCGLLILAIIEDNKFKNKTIKITEMTKKIFPELENLPRDKLINSMQYKKILQMTEEFLDIRAITYKDLFRSRYELGSRFKIGEKILKVIQTSNGKLSRGIVKAQCDDRAFANFTWMFDTVFDKLKLQDKIVHKNGRCFIKK